MAGNVQNVRPYERLAAGDHQQASLVHFGNLIDEAEALFRAEFVGSSTGFGGGVKVAVIAFEVASLGEIQCHEVRLEIVNGATIVRSRQWRRRGDELEICC